MAGRRREEGRVRLMRGRGPTERSARLLRAVLSLIVTQLIGWGTVFHVPAVLYGRIASGTGLSKEFIFAGLTIMLLIAAFLSGLVGRVLERDGARSWMVRGSCLTAAALIILSAAHGPVLFVAAWIVFGAAMPIALNQAASTALVQIAPGRARRAIAILLLVTGLSSTIAWPTLIWLSNTIGWREALVVCAVLNLTVCAPLHAWSLPRNAGFREAPNLPPQAGPPSKPPRVVRGAYTLAALSFALGGMLTWGLPLHMVGILSDFGHDEASAVWIGGLLGPGQVLARGFEMLGGERFDILTVGVLAALLMPIGLFALLLWGSGTGGAIAFAIGYGVSAGLISIVRAVAPLRLFGAAAYARILGRLNMPQNIAFASTPLGFAILRESWGSRVLVEVALGLAVLCLGATLMLAWRVRAAERSDGPLVQPGA